MIAIVSRPPTMELMTSCWPGLYPDSPNVPCMRRLSDGFLGTPPESATPVPSVVLREALAAAFHEPRHRDEQEVAGGDRDEAPGPEHDRHQLGTVQHPRSADPEKRRRRRRRREREHAEQPRRLVRVARVADAVE